MLTLKLSSPRIWLYHMPVDFRKSINGLSDIIYTEYRDWLKNSIFIFYNRSMDKLKILCWHGNGFALVYKRLEKGKFIVTPITDNNYELTEKQLSWLMAGLNWIEMSHWHMLDFDEIN